MAYSIALALLILDAAFVDVLLGMRWYRLEKARVIVVSVLLNLIAFVELIPGFIYFNPNVANPDIVERIAGLPEWVHYIIPVLLALYDVIMFYREAHLHYTSITKSSILTGVNAIDAGLMYVFPNGSIALINRRMETLTQKILGKYPSDGNRFWEKLISLDKNSRCKRIDFTQWPAVMFENGEIWNFQRKFLKDEDRVYYEIIAKDVTSLYHERKKIENETQKLNDLGEELGRVLRSISETGNKEELLNYKIRIHDQLGNAILRTRKSLRDRDFEKKNVAEILKVWENTITAFSNNVAEKKADAEEGTLATVKEQAVAMGVELVIEGKFPESNPVCVRAVREAMYNSIRHAYANKVMVNSYLAGDGYHIRISDDGQPDCTEISEGGGLKSLRHAIEEIGGSMRISIEGSVVLNIVYPVDFLGGAE